jgi:tellurite methyltransferase
MSEWSAFYDAVSQRPPHETLLRALDAFETPGLAVDLGCGDGRDAVQMLGRGWRVLAIDAEEEAIARLRARVGDDAPGRLETEVARFEDATWPQADLVNASFSLPFCAPEHFGGVWRHVVASIRAGGRFSGQLFGDRDEWAARPEMTFLSRFAAGALFAGFELEQFDEVEADGKTALERPRHWHVFHVIARRA